MNLDISLSPLHKLSDFSKAMTLDNAIDIFIAQVIGWQLNPAKNMRDAGIPDREFAMLGILLSFFEKIAKYRAGYEGKHKSAYYFKEGVLWAFPEIDKSDPNSLEMLQLMYEDIRCGLYHVGRTGTNVMVALDVSNGAFGYDADTKRIIINPDILVADLIYKFEQYADELRNPENTELRSNFEKRFLFDSA